MCKTVFILNQSPYLSPNDPSYCLSLPLPSISHTTSLAYVINVVIQRVVRR